MKNIIINADDFGISDGVNKAIILASQDGFLNSTSIMINILELNKENKNFIDSTKINLGLHLNLTNEYCIAKKENLTLLVDENGKFKNGFLKLLILSIVKNKEFTKQVELETTAQIEKLKELNINISHIDGHRHIHNIPSVFKIVQKISKKHKIKRIRIINESLLNTIKCNKDFSFLYNGGIIKYTILKSLTIFNNIFYNKGKKDTYFYSILHTGKIFKDKVETLKVPKKYNSLEIMIHPNIGNIDKIENICDKDIISKNRIKEMEMVMDKNILEKLNENN